MRTDPGQEGNRQEQYKAPHPTDAELVRCARAGDKAAFGLLAERHRSLALRMARRMLGQVDVAEEAVQEALLHAYLCLDNLQEPERFSAWLCGIVLNLCRSHLRRRPSPPLSLEALAGGVAFDALPFVSPQPGPEEIAEFHEQHRLVLAAVHDLSPKNRDAVLLFYYEQFSVREIALLLGISATAVKGRLHKSRRQLKERLAPLILPRLHEYPYNERKTRMIPVTVVDVVVQKESEHRVVVLLDAAGRRILPIWVGTFEGDAIVLHLLNQTTARPLTYTFVAGLLNAMGVALEEARVEELKDDTFYGVAKVRSGDRVEEIDARPSDVIALALRTGSPIFVAESVMERTGAPIPETTNIDSLARGLRERQMNGWGLAPLPLQQEGEETSPAEKHEAARRALLAYVFGTEG